MLASQTWGANQDNRSLHLWPSQLYSLKGNISLEARRRAAKRKMKQLKSSGKDAEELDLEEDNADIYNEIGNYH